MTAKNMMQSSRGIFKSSYLPHQKMLALTAVALSVCRRAGVASLGRALPTPHTTPKHAIKRVDAFLRSQKFDHFQAQEALLRAVIGPRQDVLIAVDWTRIRSFSVLVAGVVQRGRCVPVLWSVLDPGRVYKSINAFENGFFAWLKQALPPNVRATLLMDRGFKRVSLLRVLERLSLRFVIRSGGNVRLDHDRFHGPMQRLLQLRGTRCDLADALIHQSRPIRCRVVATWRSDQREPWYLVTDCNEPDDLVLDFYRRRFHIEETFRDEKDWRFGFALGHLKLMQPRRLEVLLLIVAFAHFVLMVVGAAARAQGLDRSFRANTGPNATQHSDFTLGGFYVFERPWPWRKSFHLFLAAVSP